MVVGKYDLFFVSFYLLPGQMHFSFVLHRSLSAEFQVVVHHLFVYSLIFVSRVEQQQQQQFVLLAVVLYYRDGQHQVQQSSKFLSFHVT